MGKMEKEAVRIIRQSQKPGQVKTWRVVGVDREGVEHSLLVKDGLEAIFLAQAVLVAPYSTTERSWVERWCPTHGWKQVDSWGRCPQCGNKPADLKFHEIIIANEELQGLCAEEPWQKTLRRLWKRRL